MPLTEAHVVPLIAAMAVFAVLLGVVANLLAARLMLERADAANDARYEQGKIVYRTRRPATRAGLKLVPPPATRGPAAGRPYLPDLVYQSACRPLLQRSSGK